MSPVASKSDPAVAAPVMGKTRLISLLVLLAFWIVCVIFAWTTRDAMAHLPFLNRPGTVHGLAGQKTNLVDLEPWQTAQALAPLAVTAEETEYAREAERLADHEVDQAFASALRLATLQSQHRRLTGKALQLSQRVTELKQLIQQDQTTVDRLTSKSASPSTSAKTGQQPAIGGDDPAVAKAQLQLDIDELSDAQRDLARASGDTSARIQAELASHEASMRQYDSQAQSDGQVAVISMARHRTLAARLTAWNSQRSRYGLIQQALQRAQADVAALTAEHNTLEAQANADAASTPTKAANHTETLTDLQDKSAIRQVLSIYDDRIQTEQQLVTVYGKWSTQVLLQHRILAHLILQSLALIFFILIAMLLADALVRRIMAHPVLERRQMHILRNILEVGTQAIGVILILLAIFGSPQQTSTILGLATAALTIALQDFILAFLGWFVLMGKNGIRVGDWVEINGVGGEVVDVGLIYTTLLETGTLAEHGHPTGRRIAFINGFAIRGQYFNFSTSGQWMWDEINLSLSGLDDPHIMLDRIRKAVLAETEQNARLAEQEWRRGPHVGLSRFDAAPVISLSPSASGIEVEVRYVTRASERFDVRNRLNQRVVELLHEYGQHVEPAAPTASASPASN